MKFLFEERTEWDLATDGSRPSAAGTASAALKLATLKAVLAFATCTYVSRISDEQPEVSFDTYSSRAFR